MLAGGKKSLAAGAVAVAAALTLAACGDSGSNQTTETSTPAAVSATASAEAAENHNPADVMFAQHMIPHHSQAIEMSDIVLAKQDIDPPRVAEVAQQIKPHRDRRSNSCRAGWRPGGDPVCLRAVACR